MNHVAVDLGSRKSQFCVRTPQGQVLRQAKVKTEELGKLFQQLDAPCRVVLETSAEAFAVADMAKSAGHEVAVVPASLAPSLGVGQRGVKTDERDAQALSLASCRMGQLPSVYCPPVETRERRAMLTARATLVATRTALVNSVKGWARTQLLILSGGKTSTFPERARARALEKPCGMPQYIERTLKVIEALNEQIALADEELRHLAKEDAVCQKLMTMPGVGPVTATTFRVTLGEVTRFKTAHAVQSYVGLTPGESSSGMKSHRLGITRAGSARMRTALIQAAWCAYRTQPDEPMVQWARRIAERRPVQVAIVALARKMAGILYAMWRDEATYSPTHQQ
jgi:transposase